MACRGEEYFQFNDPNSSVEKLSLESDLEGEPNSDEKETSSDECFQEFASMDLFDSDSEKDNVSDYSSGEDLSESDLENRQIYYHRRVSSGGFDVDNIPGLFYRALHSLEPLKEGDEEYVKVCNLSKLGIAKYNRDNGTNFEFIKYVKAMWSLCAGCCYYLTFEAKEAVDCAPTTFQAMVYNGIPDWDGTENIEVVLVRMKSRATIERKYSGWRRKNLKTQMSNMCAMRSC